MKTETATAERAKRSKAATPWGQAAIVEEVRMQQQAAGKRFAVVVQLLESGSGEPLLRVAYTTDGVARRGPVTLRGRDLERLRKAVAGKPGLAAAFDLEGDA